MTPEEEHVQRMKKIQPLVADAVCKIAEDHGVSFYAVPEVEGLKRISI